VLFLDLDRFKILNDTLGQEVGDRLLVEVAHRLAACLSPEDTVARLGGDEFALLLEDTSVLSTATALAERVSAEIQRPFVVDGRDVLISASIGVALTGGGSMQPEEVLHNADLAMYQAKAEGRARYELYEPGLNVTTRERLDLQADLRTAGARQELSLRYQPVVTLASIRPVEVEALVRWTTTRGALLPADFIGLEETGYRPDGPMDPREACRQARAWQTESSEMPPLIVSVNLSAGQFERTALPEEVATIVRETGLEPGRLQLEISEAVLMRDDPQMLDRLEALKAIGVRLAIDDFGTGYASLSYLKRLPVDCLKIDRSLVKGVAYETEDTAIIRAVTSLAKSLGITVTAEGVETHEQLPAARGGLRSGPGLLLRAAGVRGPRPRAPREPRRRRPAWEPLMARLTLRGLARTLVMRLIGIVAFTGALGIGLSLLLEAAVSEPEWTETAAIAQRAVDRAACLSCSGPERAQPQAPGGGERALRVSCPASSRSRSGTRRARWYGRSSPGSSASAPTATSCATPSAAAWRSGSLRWPRRTRRRRASSRPTSPTSSCPCTARAPRAWSGWSSSPRRPCAWTRPTSAGACSPGTSPSAPGSLCLILPLAAWRSHRRTIAEASRPRSARAAHPGQRAPPSSRGSSR
jgi:diguanylate cyclase (GGDEF)-like protein